MKNISFIISIIITLTVSAFCQTDSIIYFKNADFTLFRTQKVKYQSSGEIKLVKQFTILEDIRTLTFLNNDSLILSKYRNKYVYTSLSNINEVNRYKYHFSPVLGTVIGVVGGGLIGAGFGYLTASGESDYSFATIGSSAIGALVGGLLGAGITYLINHPALDLYSVPDKDKRNELIKFIKYK
jgi:hypothetical protein